MECRHCLIRRQGRLVVIASSGVSPFGYLVVIAFQAFRWHSKVVAFQAFRWKHAHSHTAAMESS